MNPSISGHRYAFYYHNDHLGTPLALSGENGELVAEWVRDPFGKVVSKTGDVEDNHMFPGQFWDAAANLAYNWNRWYSPEIGRYVEVDPVIELAYSPSEPAYVYAGNSPILFFDSEGLERRTATLCGTKFRSALGGFPKGSRGDRLFGNNEAWFCLVCEDEISDIQYSGSGGAKTGSDAFAGGSSMPDGCRSCKGLVLAYSTETRDSTLGVPVGSVTFECKCE